jgi:CheY-like chemotaxis protein
MIAKGLEAPKSHPMATAKRPSILLVEDHSPDAFLIQRAIRESGVECDVTRYADGEQALAAIEKMKLEPDTLPGLVLLDLNLPRIGGMEILRAIQQDPNLAGIRVAVLTSSQDPRDKDQAMALGATRFVTKPAELRVYMQVIGQLVQDLFGAPTPSSERQQSPTC